MKCICKNCGYIYNEEYQSLKFCSLPELWVCPICKSAKSEFEVEQAKNESKEKNQMNGGQK